MENERKWEGKKATDFKERKGRIGRFSRRKEEGNDVIYKLKKKNGRNLKRRKIKRN